MGAFFALCNVTVADWGGGGGVLETSPAKSALLRIFNTADFCLGTEVPRLSAESILSGDTAHTSVGKETCAQS